MKANPNSKPIREREWFQAAKQHALADVKCGRDWNANGCQCGGCRLARAYGFRERGGVLAATKERT